MIFFQGASVMLTGIGNAFWVRVSIFFHQRIKIVCGLYWPYLFLILHTAYVVRAND